MVIVNWETVEECIASGETTREKQFELLKTFVNNSITTYEELLEANKKYPEVYSRRDFYKKMLNECYQAISDLNRGIPIKEFPI
jgi:hypothetical protein